MAFSKLSLIAILFALSFANAHMWLRTPLSIGGADNIGGTGAPCNGLTPGAGGVTAYEQSQNVTFQFRVNQHGSDPFSFKLSTDGGKTFSTILASGIVNQVTAGPDSFQGVNVPVQIPNVLCTNCVVQLSGMGTNGAGTWYQCANVKIVTPGSLGIAFPNAIQPSAGSTAGGTTVSITGTGFGLTSTSYPNTMCRFDFATVPATWVSSTQITCVTPPKNTPADAIVSVTLDGTTYSNTGLVYSYTGGTILPVVDSFSPTSGGPGTVITITGNYFYSSAMQCKLNNTVVAATQVSTTQATCTVPATLSGNGYVTLEINVDGSVYSQSGSEFIVGSFASTFTASVSRAFGLAILLILGALFV